MKKIKFGEFELVSLFKTIARGTRLTTTNRVIGETPLITAGKDNFGISQHISNGETLFSGVNLTIDMFGNSFVRDYMYYADDNIISLSGNMSVGSLLYIKSQLEWLTKAYSYSNQFRINSLEDLSVRLPINDEGAPDWVYMEEYIESIKKKFIESKIAYKDSLKERLASLLENKQKYELEDVEFGEFLLEDVFVVSGTKSIDRSKVVDNKGGVNFIGRTISNNGVQSQIERLEYPPNEPNTITASVVGVYKYVTYQLEEYYCSQNINKLSIKGNIEVSLNTIQYLMSHIQKFVDKWRGEFGGYTINEMKKHAIYIPITSSGAPNWDYMDKYIHNIKIDKVNMIVSELESEIETLSRL